MSINYPVADHKSVSTVFHSTANTILPVHEQGHFTDLNGKHVSYSTDYSHFVLNVSTIRCNPLAIGHTSYVLNYNRIRYFRYIFIGICKQITDRSVFDVPTGCPLKVIKKKQFKIILKRNYNEYLINKK